MSVLDRMSSHRHVNKTYVGKNFTLADARKAIAVERRWAVCIGLCAGIAVGAVASSLLRVMLYQ